MPNIILLNYCNLSCSYCFANKFIEETAKQLITLEQLDNIFKFLEQSHNVGKIGLIGGEPTLHPQFEEIVNKTINFSEKNHLFKPIIFSNGIKIERCKDFINQVNLLLNINEPEIIGNKNLNTIINNLRLLNSLCNLNNQITIGINLYPNIKNYNFIFDLTKEFNLNRIRCSIVAPACQYTNINQEVYYNNLMKPIFLDFLQLAISHNIQINMDCNKIPLCYFSEQEKEQILKITKCYTSYCNPVIDITPDMKATNCFGAYDLIDLKQFNTLEDVERYFNFKTIYPKILKNKNERCLKCEKFFNLSCQGGCLAFRK